MSKLSKLFCRCCLFVIVVVFVGNYTRSKYKNLIISTWANLFAAQKSIFPVAEVIIPLVYIPSHVQAVLISEIVVWIVWWPERDPPGSAVCPLPRPLLLYVAPSYPNIVQACSLHPLHDKGFGGVRGVRGQMAALPLAEVLSFGPVLFVGSPEVAVVAILLPVISAGLDALVATTPWAWKILKVNAANCGIAYTHTSNY